MWVDGSSWVRDTEPSVHEDHVLRLDASRARLELGWKPRLNIETALEWTMTWYRAWNEDKNMVEFTNRQIADYEQLNSQRI
jgi:CDP-glucose 4,6-dehydratase